MPSTTISALAGRSRSVVVPRTTGIGSPFTPPAYSYSEMSFGNFCEPTSMNSGSIPQAAATWIGFALLPRAGDVQQRILARREVQPGLRLALHHHPVGPDVEIAVVRDRA